MTVWTPTRTRNISSWRAVVPRSRLAMDLERPLLVLIALIYIVMLILVYLHVLGQTAAIKAATVQLEAELRRLEEEVALATYEAVPSVQEIAETSMALPQQVPVIVYSEEVAVPPARVQMQVERDTGFQGGASYWRAWLGRFGIRISP